MRNLILAAALVAVSINGTGHVARGVAGAGAYIDATTLSLATAGGTSWVDDDHVIYQVCDGKTPGGCRIEEYTLSTGARKTVDPTGANALAAGGGIWAKWGACKSGPTCGVVTSTGVLMPNAGLGDVGPDGALAYKDVYQSYGPYHVLERDGSVWKFSDGPAYDIELLGQHRIIWTSAQRVYTMGLPAPQTIVPLVWRPRVAFLGSEGWVAYWTNERGLVMHPFNDASKGYILRTTPDAFNHDIASIGPRTIRASWGLNQGETTYVVKDVNVDADPRVPLAPVPPPPPPPPPPPVPSVAQAAVQVNAFTLTPKANLPDGTVFDLTDPNNPKLGTHVRAWVEGGSIFFSIDYPGAGPNLAGQTHSIRKVR